MERTVRHITRQTLESFGDRVVEAADGVQAFEVFAAQDGLIDVVLTDMMLRMDGATVIQRLRERSPDLAIVATSGFSSAVGEVLGADRLISKPCVADTLLTVLAEVLASSRGTVVASTVRSDAAARLDR